MTKKDLNTGLHIKVEKNMNRANLSNFYGANKKDFFSIICSRVQYSYKCRLLY